MSGFDRALAVLVVLLLSVVLSIVSGLRPFSEQPLLLRASSELSGEMSILLTGEDSMTFETTVNNQNGIPNTITTTVSEYETPELAHAAHVDAINRWLADDTAGS